VTRLAQILVATLAAPAVVVAVVWLGERGLRRVSARTRNRLRPWLWLAPTIVLVGVFLAWPLVNSLFLSVRSADSSRFVGLDNYRAVFDDPSIRTALRNNLLWLALLVPGTLVFGLLLAVLTDRVRYERVAKTIIFVPMAISFVAAGTIWKFMYDYRPPGSPQTGTANALWLTLGLGAQPRAWLVETSTNNLALIVVGIWSLTGFAMVILSAGLKGIPTELLEASRVDGANEWQVFRRVTLPLLRPTVIVVATAMFINAIKIFDIVFVLTNGQFDTGVIGTEMYRQLFTVGDRGRASMISVLLLVAAAPIVVSNLRHARRTRSSG
jgi:alpha-glucoside transport system permease protein